jgi:cathepsin L
MARVLLVLLSFAAFAAAVRQIQDEDIPKYTFEDYIQDWGKSYPSHLDYSMHKEMFEIRKAAIIRQNAIPNASWKAGFSKFTDMTEKEFKGFRGYNTRLSTRPADAMPPLPTGGDYPPSLDWRKVNGVVTAVKDQGSCGSCWAFSTTESIESIVAIGLNITAPVLSPQQVVSCTQNPDHCGGTGGCNGATAELGIGYVSANGICYNSDWPYTATTGTCNPAAHNPPVYKVAGVTQMTTNSYDALMTAVQTQPVSVSVDASTWSIYQSGVFNCTAKDLDIDHAVQVVGYGNDPTSGLDYWIVRNSWGSSWGESGYIRLLRHSDGSSKWCWPDTTPSDGSGCDDGPPVIQVCGTCGIWYDNCVPYVPSPM